jgi:hypothetical protein
VKDDESERAGTGAVSSKFASSPPDLRLSEDRIPAPLQYLTNVPVHGMNKPPFLRPARKPE